MHSSVVNGQKTLHFAVKINVNVKNSQWASVLLYMKESMFLHLLHIDILSFT